MAGNRRRLMIGDPEIDLASPFPCGHTRARPVYAYSPVAGRVAIDHYECAECPTNSTEED